MTKRAPQARRPRVPTARTVRPPPKSRPPQPPAVETAELDPTVTAAPAEERVPRTVEMMIEHLGADASTYIDASLDGDSISGDYVVFDAVNTPFVGPNLFLAPEAHVGDGLMDLVTVAHDDRATFREALAHWKRGAIVGSDMRPRRGHELRLLHLAHAQCLARCHWSSQ